MAETPDNADSQHSAEPAWVDLGRYTSGDYHPGRGVVTRVLWHYVSVLVFESGWFPVRGLKVALLRAFGAQIGRDVTIKPNVRIKYPWRLAVGDHVWIGQEAWIDNLAAVRIGNHVCLSQRTYLCTGSHDAKRTTFDLITGEIVLEDGCWVAAGATVLGGATIGPNALVAAGSVVKGDIPAGKFAGGVPARVLADRARPEAC